MWWLIGAACAVAVWVWSRWFFSWWDAGDTGYREHCESDEAWLASGGDGTTGNGGPP